MNISRLFIVFLLLSMAFRLLFVAAGTHIQVTSCFPVVLDALHQVFLHHLFLDIQQTDGVFYPEEDVEVSSSCL